MKYKICLYWNSTLGSVFSWREREREKLDYNQIQAQCYSVGFLQLVHKQSWSHFSSTIRNPMPAFETYYYVLITTKFNRKEENHTLLRFKWCTMNLIFGMLDTLHDFIKKWKIPISEVESKKIFFGWNCLMDWSAALIKWVFVAIELW